MGWEEEYSIAYPVTNLLTQYNKNAEGISSERSWDLSAKNLKTEKDKRKGPIHFISEMM
jgi:hypothetical protein